MKFNILYVFWVVLFIIAGVLMNSFVKSSRTTIFGTADTEGQILNYESPVVVNKVYVRAGTQVKKGDTLMILRRPELDREAARRTNEIQVTTAEKQARVKNADSEIEKLRSDYAVKTNDLRSQIQLLESEERTQAALRKVVDGRSDSKSIIIEKINTLKKALSVEEQRFQMQYKELSQARAAESTVFDSKESTVNQEINFLSEAKDKLILLAPIDGYIEGVFVFENQITPQYSQLVKINPQKPNKVKGFLPESVDIAYRLGDTVEVYSARRPSIRSKAILIGSTPQLIELPTRLRKLQTVSSWGRELYISLPSENDFFIGEKMIIKMNGQ